MFIVHRYTLVLQWCSALNRAGRYRERESIRKSMMYAQKTGNQGTITGKKYAPEWFRGKGIR